MTNDLTTFVRYMQDHGWEPIVDFDEDPRDCRGLGVSVIVEEIRATELCNVEWHKPNNLRGWTTFTPYEGEDFLCNYGISGPCGQLQDQWFDEPKDG